LAAWIINLAPVCSLGLGVLAVLPRPHPREEEDAKQIDDEQRDCAADSRVRLLR